MEILRLKRCIRENQELNLDGPGELEQHPQSNPYYNDTTTCEMNLHSHLKNEEKEKMNNDHDNSDDNNNNNNDKDEIVLTKHHKIILREIGKSMNTIVDKKIVNDIATVEKMDLSDYSYFSERLDYSDSPEYAVVDGSTYIASNTDSVEQKSVRNTEDTSVFNENIKEHSDRSMNTKECNELEMTTENTPRPKLTRQQTKKILREEELIIESDESEGIFVKNVEDLMCTLKSNEHDLIIDESQIKERKDKGKDKRKDKRNDAKIGKRRYLNNTNEDSVLTKHKIAVESEERKNEHVTYREYKKNINSNSDINSCSDKNTSSDNIKINNRKNRSVSVKSNNSSVRTSYNNIYNNSNNIYNNSNNIYNNNNDNKDRSTPKKKFTAVDYKMLCKTKKMSVIDIIEDPYVEQKLVKIVKKMNLNVHWEDDVVEKSDGSYEEEKEQKEILNGNQNKEKGRNKQRKGKAKVKVKEKEKENEIKNENENEIENKNKKEKEKEQVGETRNNPLRSALKNNFRYIKSVKQLIKNSDVECEFDAAIDLLKSYNKLKQTHIYYISDDEKSLLPGQISISQKIINVHLADRKMLQIKIENIKNIKRIDNPLSNKKFSKIKGLEHFHLLVITYEHKPKNNRVFSIIFQNKLKLCLFLSLIKSYYRINFNLFSEKFLELMSRYNNGTDVKKVSKRGNIKEIKIMVSGTVIRFFSITKMKGQIFDVIEDFISYETGANTSFFHLLNEHQKKELNEESCLVLHFTYTSIPIIFSSPDERDDFVLLLLFIRNQQ